MPLANGLTSTGGALVISLDFELMWGLRDKYGIASYGRNILGVRQAIPAMLKLFAARGIACTWATVGFLFCADKDELMDSLPAVRPAYRRPGLSPYDILAGIGRDEASDPYHFGLSLLQQVQAAPLQEIATHTFSHFCCLEEGGDTDAFRADLLAARQVAERRGVPLASIVLPRNQVSVEHLRVCRTLGLTAFRGNERVWFHRARRDEHVSLPVRALRLADSYLPLGGAHAHAPTLVEGLVDVAASRFLRPSTGTGPFEWVRLARITTAMEQAARRGTVFHLWWHPHNFGVDFDANLAFLTAILDRFRTLQDRYGMRSLTMTEVAAETLRAHCGVGL
jgi:hypothetical protein